MSFWSSALLDRLGQWCCARVLCRRRRLSEKRRTATQHRHPSHPADPDPNAGFLVRQRCPRSGHQFSFTAVLSQSAAGHTHVCVTVPGPASGCGCQHGNGNALDDRCRLVSLVRIFIFYLFFWPALSLSLCHPCLSLHKYNLDSIYCVSVSDLRTASWSADPALYGMSSGLGQSPVEHPSVPGSFDARSFYPGAFPQGSGMYHSVYPGAAPAARVRPHSGRQGLSRADPDMVRGGRAA